MRGGTAPLRLRPFFAAAPARFAADGAAPASRPRDAHAETNPTPARSRPLAPPPRGGLLAAALSSASSATWGPMARSQPTNAASASSPPPPASLFSSSEK